MQKRLILFCGLPGSGKTTISKKLCRAIGASLIDLDDFKKTDVDPTLVTTEIDPPELRWSYYQKGLREAVRLFATGVNDIVVDEVFHLDILRRQIEEFCSLENITVIWVEVQCPYRVVQARLLSKPRVGHILSSEEALAMYRMFEKIFEPITTSNHKHILISNVDTDEVDEKVTYILNSMNGG